MGKEGAGISQIAVSAIRAVTPAEAYMEILESYLSPEQLAGAKERFALTCEQQGWARTSAHGEECDVPLRSASPARSGIRIRPGRKVPG